MVKEGTHVRVEGHFPHVVYERIQTRVTYKHISIRTITEGFLFKL